MGGDRVMITWEPDNSKDKVPESLAMQFDDYDAKFRGVDDAKVMNSRVQLVDYGACNVTLGQSDVVPRDIIGRILEFLCDSTFLIPERGESCIIYEWSRYHPDLQPLSAVRPKPFSPMGTCDKIKTGTAHTPTHGADVVVKKTNARLCSLREKRFSM